jgi:hypothetical protein
MSTKSFRLLNENTPTPILVEEFKNGIRAISEYLRDVSRTPESLQSEELLLARGNEVIPDLFVLLKKNNPDAVRFFTIELLGKFGTRDVFDRLLLRVRHDPSPTCRYAALTKFAGTTDPKDMESLVAAMQHEVVTSYDLHQQEKVAGITKFILSIVAGSPQLSLGEKMLQSVVGKVGRGLFIDPYQTNLAKLKPLERLAAFADAYRSVLLSSPAVPITELIQLMRDPDEHVRVFMAREWLLPLLTQQQLHGLHAEVTVATVDLTRDTNASVRDFAIAALVNAGTPETEKVVQQLENSSSTMRKTIQHIRAQQKSSNH